MPIRALLPCLAICLLVPAAPAFAADPAPGGDGAAAPAGAPAVPAPAAPAGHLDDTARHKLHTVLANADAFKVRMEAALILGRRGDAADDLGVLRQAMRSDPSNLVRGAAALAIGHLGSPRGVESLLGALEDDDAFVRDAATRAVKDLAGPRAIPYLEEATHHDNPRVRRVAVKALGGIQRPEARRALVEFLGDPDPGVRSAVAKVLGTWPREQAVRLLLAALSDPGYRVRAEAATLAEHFPDPRFIGPLADRLAAPLEAPEVQMAAARSLTALRPLLDVEDLVKHEQGLVDRDARAKAILLLGFAGGARAVSVLEHVLKDPDVGLRGYAAMSLGRCGDTRVVPVLMGMQKDPKNKRILGVIRAALMDLETVTSQG